MDNEKEVTGIFRFEQDTKRFHRFKIEMDGGVTGTIYIPKDRQGAPMPKRLVLEYAK